MVAVEARDIRKVFRVAVRRSGRFGSLTSMVRPLMRETVAVDGIGFTLSPGERVGYLGPNGAGKSTTVKMLAGILVPDGGEVRVQGLVPHRSRAAHSRNVGVVFGQRSQLLFDLPVRDSFDLLRYLYRIPGRRHRENVERFSELLEVGALLDRPARTLSLGERMRCEILAALLHEPSVLFLDEPTIGLDVVAKDRIRDFVERASVERGVTVLLTTHDLTDIERLCPRVIIIDRGRAIYDGGLAHIRRRLATERKVVAVFPDPAGAARAAGAVTGLPAQVSLDGRTVQVTCDQRAVPTGEVVRRLLAEGDPEDLVVQEETIESLVRRIYRQEAGADGLLAAWSPGQTDP